jgi:amino acid transporter
VAEFTAAGEAPQLTDEGLDRGVGFFGLLWSSETSLIGSGWLFGALTAAVIAGPSAIIGWVLGGVIIAVLALIHAELGGLFPVTGGTSRFPHYAFGSFAGATFGWASYLQAASVAPVEVLATIQYASNWSFAKNWYSASGTLHGVGIAVAVGLTFLFAILNIVGIRWLARVSNAITVWKVVIPVLTILILLIGHFHSQNFDTFFTPTASVKSILDTLPAGVVFSLLGFEQAVQLAGEARNPQKDVARAVIVSLVIGVIIYLLVQVAFIGAMDPTFLSAHGGWLKLGNTSNPALTNLNNGPFWTIASMAGIGWLAAVLRIDAVISPSGTALIYQTSSSRLSFGMSRNGFVPELFEKVDSHTRVPVFGIVVAALVGLLFLLPFPSWNKLVGVVTSASVLMYAAAPLALGALRKQKPDLPRPYRLPGAAFWAPAGFVGATWVVVFSGWQTYTTLIVAMLIGYVLIWLSYAFKLNSRAPAMDWQALPWIAGYFIGLLVILYFGSFGAGGIIGGIGVFQHVLDHGGNDALGLAGTLLLSAAWAVLCYFWAINRRLPETEVDEYVEDVYPTELAGE